MISSDMLTYLELRKINTLIKQVFLKHIFSQHLFKILLSGSRLVFITIDQKEMDQICPSQIFAHVWTNDNLLKNCVEIYQFLQKMRQYWSVYITRTEHRV